MISSRKIEDLDPVVAGMAKAMKTACTAEGIDFLITSTYRDFESQQALYAQGRTTPGRIVTKAKAGQSYHNWRVAFDVVPVRNGKLVWDDKDPLWQELGRIGKECGLEWGGDWISFRDLPHFQFTGGRSLADFQKGLA